MSYELLDQVLPNWRWLTGLIGGPLGAGVIGTMIRAFVRRPRTTGQASRGRFRHEALLSPPMERPAYSDRMAYVLAEMSALAYYRFETEDGLVNDLSEIAAARSLSSDREAAEFLSGFASRLLNGRNLGLNCFRQVLGDADFALLEVIDVAETQGFVCRRSAANEPPYVVVAFRGTEKKVSDWLTDADCKPDVDGQRKVHRGFLKALTDNQDSSDRTVKDIVESALQSAEAQDENGRPLPVFITGHSLGGALALLTTVLVAPDVNGACLHVRGPKGRELRVLPEPEDAGVSCRQLKRRRAEGAAGFGDAAVARRDSGSRVGDGLVAGRFGTPQEGRGAGRQVERIPAPRRPPVPDRRRGRPVRQGAGFCRTRRPSTGLCGCGGGS